MLYLWKIVLININLFRFGTKSLTIHLNSCKQKFNLQQSQKIQKSLRIKLPSPPAQLAVLLSQIEQTTLDDNLLANYNQQALNIFKYKVLPACKYCGRTFNEQSLIIHLKSCSKKDQFTQKQSGYKLPQQIRKPRTLVCCICGRQFGLNSLKIHYPQCKQKFINEQQQKPYKERSPVPQFTQEQQQMINNKTDWTVQQIQAFNQKASTNYRNKALVQCQNCKRKFLPQSYQRHLKNCKLINGDNIDPNRQKSKDNSYSQQKDIRRPKVLMCHICGRQFGLTSLKIHLKSCSQKFQNQEKKRSLRQRRPLPELNCDNQQFDINETESWQIQKIQRYNSAANQVYKEKSMFSCKICGRKFIKQALQRHLNYCEKNEEKKQLKQFSKSPSKSPIKRQAKTPNKISSKHLLNTTNKNLSIELKKDKIQITSKNEQNLPTQTPISIQKQKQNNQFRISKQNFKDTIKQVNEEFQSTLKNHQYQNKQTTSKVKPVQQFSEQLIDLNRIQCTKCNRKFAEDRIQKHQSICKGKKQKSQPQKFKQNSARQSKIQKPFSKNKQKIDPSQQNNQFLNQMEKKQQKIEILSENNIIKKPESQLKQCTKCGKKLMPSKLEKHMAHCKDVVYKSKKHKDTSLLNNNEIEQIKINQKINQKFQPKVQQQRPQQKQIFKQVKKLVQKVKQQLSSKQLKQPQVSTKKLIQQTQTQPETTLTKCKYCNRKFNSDRVQKHQSVCASKKNTQLLPIPIPKKQIKQDKKTQQNFYQKQNQQEIQIQEKQINVQLKNCAKCNRKFAIDRIQKHQNVCKGMIKKQKVQKMQPIKQSERVSQIKTQKKQKILTNKLKKISQQEFNEPFLQQKKKNFVVKPLIKKGIQNPKQSITKSSTKSNLLQENLKLTNQILNQIWDTKQRPDIKNDIQSRSKIITDKKNKTSAEGFYSRNQNNQSKMQNVTSVNQKEKQTAQLERKDSWNKQIKNTNKTPNKIVNEGQNFRIPSYRNIRKRQFNNKSKNQQQSRYDAHSQQDKNQHFQTPSSKLILNEFKNLKQMKINQSLIDAQIQQELNSFRNKSKQPIKSSGFARKTYGGEKFYNKIQQNNQSANNKFINEGQINQIKQVNIKGFIKKQEPAKKLKDFYLDSPKVSMAKKWIKQLPKMK